MDGSDTSDVSSASWPRRDFTLSVSNFATGSAHTNHQWARGVEVEALPRTTFAALMAKRKDAVLEIRDELQGKPGDKISTFLRIQDTSAPEVGADAALEGNEGSPTYYSDALYLSSAHKAYRWRKFESNQRINHDEREEARLALADTVANALDTSFFNQICGNTRAAAGFDGLNTVTAPTRHLWIDDANNSADEDLDSADTLDLTAIDVLVEQAKVGTYPIQPAYIPALGSKHYVLFLHPYQVSQLRTSSTLWQNIQRDRLAGGDIAGNPLLSGALGIYNNVLLVESSRVPTGTDSSSGAEVASVRRAAFCGAQAAQICWGRSEHGTPNKFTWSEEQFNYGLECGIAVHMVYGMKRLDYNSTSFGSIVLSTYGAASNA